MQKIGLLCAFTGAVNKLDNTTTVCVITHNLPLLTNAKPANSVEVPIEDLTLLLLSNIECIS